MTKISNANHRPLSKIAADIAMDWKKMGVAALPYVMAMRNLNHPWERYIAEDGYAIVSGFLANAQSWRGPVAKRIKEELKNILEIVPPVADVVEFKRPATKTPTTGEEWIIDVYNCDPGYLKDKARMQEMMNGIAMNTGLVIVGNPQWKKFHEPGAGVTGLYLLSESHLTIHTYPEHGFAAINLYTCRLGLKVRTEEFADKLIGYMGHDARIETKNIRRGGGLASGDAP